LKGFVLLGKTPEQLSVVAQQLGQPKYRGKQILDGILSGCRDVLDLRLLPKGFREQLSESGTV
jgi:23S rRNA (adenine2503-C2)-methyltransferase